MQDQVQGGVAPATPPNYGNPKRRFDLSGLTPYLLVAPIVLIASGGVVLGLSYLGQLSLQQHIITRPDAIEYIGIDNYLAALKDDQFWRALRASLTWVIGSVVPQFLLGLGLALLLNEQFRGRAIFRTIAIGPWAVSGVVTGIMWLWIFDGTIGVLNDVLFKLDAIERPIAWGIRTDKTWFMLFVANAWRGTPFFAVMFLAALQGIPTDLYEAARIDGAGGWKSFRFITLPLIRNTIILSTLLRAIWTFNYIDLIFTMTKGGPIGSTRTLAMYIYDTAFIRSDFGYAAAMAMITCGLLLVFSLIYWTLGKVEENY